MLTYPDQMYRTIDEDARSVEGSTRSQQKTQIVADIMAGHAGHALQEKPHPWCRHCVAAASREELARDSLEDLGEAIEEANKAAGRVLTEEELGKKWATASDYARRGMKAMPDIDDDEHVAAYLAYKHTQKSHEQSWGYHTREASTLCEDRVDRFLLLRGVPDLPGPVTDDRAVFDSGLLVDILDREATPQWRAEGITPADGRTLVIAKAKTGKTTIVDELARSWLLGEDFLGRFPVRKLSGQFAVLDFEMADRQRAEWAYEHGVPADRLLLVSLRGRRNPFAHDGEREALAEHLRSHDVEALVVDPFGRAYTGKSQNDPGEVGAWLQAFDWFARAAGVSDVILTAHAGLDGERVRGATALNDWADAILTMVRDKDDTTVRYLSAEGRDVLVEEDRLTFDPLTRRLALADSGSRKATSKARQLERLIPAVVEAVVAMPGLSGYKLAQILRDAGQEVRNGDPVRAAKIAVDRGLLRVEDGPRNSHRYYPATDLSPPVRTYPDAEVNTTSPPVPTSLLGGDGGRGVCDPSEAVDLSRETDDAIDDAVRLLEATELTEADQ